MGTVVTRLVAWARWRRHPGAMRRWNHALRCQLCRRLLAISHIPGNYDKLFMELTSAPSAPSASGGVDESKAAPEAAEALSDGASDAVDATAAVSTVGSDAGADGAAGSTPADASGEGAAGEDVTGAGADGDGSSGEGGGTGPAGSDEGATAAADAEAMETAEAAETTPEPVTVDGELWRPASPTTSGKVLAQLTDTIPDSVQFVRVLSEFCTELSGVDLPLCDTCMTSVQHHLAREVKVANKLDTNRRSFLGSLEAEVASLGHDPTDLDKELAALLEEEEALARDLAAVDAELAAQRRAEAALAAKEKRLEGMIRRYWGMVNRRSVDRRRAQKQLLSYNHRQRYCKQTLGCFHRINVFSDAFFVWHDGAFGTINGLRLGRLPVQPVDWVEINAAIGYCAALLDSVAERARFKFRKYDIRALGSFTRLTKKGEPKNGHDLYWDGRFLQRRRLNNALRALFQCLGELCKCAEAADRSFKLPYRIVDDTVGSYKFILGDDVEWTQAMKAMMTLLKWLLAWVTKTSARGRSFAGSAGWVPAAATAGAGSSSRP